jgi:hypothetical protein
MALAAPAHAVSTASVTISGFTYELFDIDGDSSTVPEVTFLYDQSYSYAGAEFPPLSDYQQDDEAGFLADTAAMASAGPNSSSASTGAGQAMAMGSAYGPGGGVEGYFGAGGYGYSGFELAPWTAIKLTLTVDATASTSVGDNQEYASGYAYLSIDINNESGWESHSAQRGAFASCAWNGMTCVPESNSFAGSFSLAFANLSDDMASGTMSAQAYAYGYSTVPVPEPGTYAMLLAGLAGIGAVVRRQRRVG